MENGRGWNGGDMERKKGGGVKDEREANEESKELFDYA